MQSQTMWDRVAEGGGIHTTTMKPLKIFSTSLVTALSGALMPGPVLVITVAAVVQVGFVAAPLIVLGHSILELLLVVAMALGLRNVLKSRFVTGAVGVVGGSVLLWFAFGMIASAYAGISAPKTAAVAHETTNTYLGLIGKGAATSLSNPYWLIWWATIGTTYMLVSLEKGIADISAFYIGHISADFAWYSAVAAALVLGKQVLSDRIYTALITICGLFLMYLGLYFFYSGVRKFLQRTATCTQESGD